LSHAEPRDSWIDQFLLRDDGFQPFHRVAAAAESLARVAEDRAGLSRSTYERVRHVRYQALVLADLARLLDEDVSVLTRRADAARHPGVDPAERARVLASTFGGSVRATATLVDTCHALLGVAQELLVIPRTRSRIELMAAVGGLRGAASTAHFTVLVNLPRVTDSAVYDELSVGLGSLDAILALADRVASALRSDLARSAPLTADVSPSIAESVAHAG
jgi:formiminotetrahydrofolate cyclodeaminase